MFRSRYGSSGFFLGGRDDVPKPKVPLTYGSHPAVRIPPRNVTECDNSCMVDKILVGMIITQTPVPICDYNML